MLHTHCPDFDSMICLLMTCICFPGILNTVGPSLCPVHSEAKQAEMSEFGAEKVLFQGLAKR